MATLISQFELLFKDQAPVIGIEVETVLQGYFLELTNLEEKDFLYDIEFVAIPPSSGLANRKLDFNTIAILDNPGAPSDDNVFAQLELVGGSNTTYRPGGLNIRVAAQATALLVVIPQVAPIPGDNFPVERNFEVRGYVRISLPDVNGATQSPRAVNVMTTPQNRAAFYVFPNAGNLGGGVLRNQIQTGLPTSSGGSVLEVQPGA